MNDNNDQGNSRENINDSPSSCDGGSCCPSGAGSNGKSWKVVVFILIVIAAGVVLARSLVNKSKSDSTQSQQVFTAIQTDNGLGTTDLPKAIEKVEEPVEAEIKTENPPVAVETKKQEIPVKAAPSLWKADLDSLASLNKVAADSDAVFVLITATDQLNDKTITKEIEAAAQKIMANGTNISAFRLKVSAPEYANIAKQVSVPSVLAMVKGLGMSTVSGDITETKLVQAFVAASRPSGCGPGTAGCGPTGCGPATAKPDPKK